MRDHPSTLPRCRLTRLYAALCFSLCGCATNDAVFVTKTSFSFLDVDATPAGASVAHDRVEGYFGPVFDDGSVYPVTGYFFGKGSGWSREVQQVFAGGKAATVVLGEDPGQEFAPKCSDNRSRSTLLFATGTTLGVKLGFAENTVLPTSFVFGYRRKEAAWVPVTKNCQPSILATLDSNAEARSQAGDPKVKVGVGQFFATGAAATRLAADQDIRNTFKKEAKKALSNVEEFNNRLALHNNLTLEIFSCVSKVPLGTFDSVITNADELGLLASSGDAAVIRAAVDANERRGRYERLLMLRNGDEDPRTAALTVHKARVCKLATAS